MNMRKVQNTLLRRIEQQKSEINSRLETCEKLQDYYWGESRPAIFGVGAQVGPGRSILPQLLLTPRLIVNICALPDREFIQCYGVTPEQMCVLADPELGGGCVIPNIYQFKNKRWQDYAKFPVIAKMLAKHGRPNGEWITAWLQRRYCFKRYCDHFEDELRSVTITERQQSEALSAFDGSIRSWADLPGAFGHRLAYLKALGGQPGEQVIGEVLEDFKQGRHLVRSVKLQTAAQIMLVSDTTAAFGGRVTHVQPEIDCLRSSHEKLDTLGITDSESRKLQETVREFACKLVRRSKKSLANKDFFTDNIGRVAPLTDKQFKDFLSIHGQIKSGKLGQLVDAMTIELTQKNPKLLPFEQEYWSLLTQLDSRLCPISPMLNKIASIALGLSKGTRGKANAVSLAIWNITAISADLLQHTTILPPYCFRKDAPPQRLCIQWQDVKKSLKLQLRI